MSQRLETAHSQDGHAVADALGVVRERGLADGEVERRRGEHGPNVLRATRTRSAWEILGAQFKSLVVLLLVAAAIVSLIFAKWVESAAVMVVVFVNGAIGFTTELRAVRSMEALRKLGHARVRVRRDGRVAEIDAEDLVPGDVVVFEAGDVVTADMRILEASKLEANESSLTGESDAVRKSIEPVAEDAPLAERSSVLFKGTSITRGSGEAVVVATGMATELGRIASLSQEAEKAATPLERRLEALGRKLIWVTLGIAAATIAVGILRGRDVILMVETGIALAVAAIPEGLPIVATLALARGMWRMARRDALVNRLSAVETLGATSVILTDKTGTLTENQMTVTRIVVAGGEAMREIEVEGLGLEPAGRLLEDGREASVEGALRELLEVGALCNNAHLDRRQPLDDARALGDPMEVALLVVAAKGGVERAELVERQPEEREEAFDPATRAMATFQARGSGEGGYRVCVKGAPESVLDWCVRVGDQELGDEGRTAWLEQADLLAHEGLRMLAFAEREAGSIDEEPYQNLRLLGLVGMRDPARAGVREAIEACRRAGVAVVMVTGDQRATALSIARSVGIAGEGDERVVVGKELPSSGEIDTEAAEELRHVRVFARVEPEQKLRLIEAHQAGGAIVAMTGDGVNDAPALRKADIGVAMGKRGTQVAREAADMVLQDDSFESIVRAIRQGRVIFGNIRRFVLYLLSCNISEIMIVFGATLVGLPLPILPLQILFLNLVTDVFPALALGFGEGDETVMDRPPREAKEPIMGRSHWLATGGYGVLMALTVIGSLVIAREVLEFERERAVTVSFLTLAMVQVWHVFNMRDARAGVVRNDVVRNPWVWGAIGLCGGLLVLAVYLPGLSDALGAVDPGLQGWGVALAASVVPLVVGQAAMVVRRGS